MRFKFESIKFLLSISLRSFLSIVVIVCNPAFHYRWMQIILMHKVLISDFSITVFFSNHHLKFKTVFRHNLTALLQLDFSLILGSSSPPHGGFLFPFPKKLSALSAISFSGTIIQKEYSPGGTMRTLRDAVYGLAVGDALGLPVQFEERGSFHVEKMTGYGTYNMAPGTWSDDTSLTLATCDSIKLMGRIDLEDLMCCMTDWYKNGKYTPDGKSFDVGMTTGAALSRGEGLSDEASNGNGSLMRIIPLAFLPEVTDDEIREVSALTHGHRISKSACVTYIHIARELLQGRSIKEAVETAVNDGIEESLFKNLLTISSLPVEQIKSTGYVADTLEAAIWTLENTDNFKDAVMTAVNLGDDTDTVGAVTGALAGIIYGYDAIPAEWLKDLRRKDLIDKYLFQ